MAQLTDMKQLGCIIRQTRKEQNLTQKQLSATCGVGERFIRELEQGKETCHIGKVLLVMSMLGIHLTIQGLSNGNGLSDGYGDMDMDL